MSETTEKVSEHDARLEELEARLANAEAVIARILAHLDPTGTSKTLRESDR